MTAIAFFFFFSCLSWHYQKIVIVEEKKKKVNHLDKLVNIQVVTETNFFSYAFALATEQ